MENVDLAARRRQRRAEQAARKAKKKRLRKQIALGAGVLALIILLCVLIGALSKQKKSAKNPQEEQSTQSTQPSDSETTITIAFGGDLNITDKTVDCGMVDGGYDYSDIFTDVLPALAGADATVLNFEGNLCSGAFGSKNANAPMEMAEALTAAGVDMVQMANSYSIRNGLLGLEESLKNIRKAGLEPLGAYESNEEFAETKGFTLRSIHGVKVAFVAFTKGMDSLGLPENEQDRVNLLYEDYSSTYQKVDKAGISAVLDAANEAKPDVIIALLHWGSEFNNQVSGTQTEIVELMQEKGVDAIIGTHSHYVQQVDYNEQTGQLVAYSLGDFFGDADKKGTEYSMILELEITKNNITGATKITEYDYTPIYTVTPGNSGSATTRILRIREAMAAYEANSIGKVSDATYQSMKSALAKIQAKAEPED